MTHCNTRSLGCALVAVMGSCLILLPASRAAALTAPQPGAVAKPPGLALVPPFPCGVSYRVVCGYYCNGLHKNTDSTIYSNDYYALDLDRAEAGGGQGKPVVAAAAGTVRFAGWTTGGWQSYGQMVLVELDYSQSGHSYITGYAHLESISVTVGQHVDAREPIGTLGRSGNQQLQFWPAPQVHFVLYQDALIAGGPYGGAAVVPEPLDGLQDIVTGTSATVSCTLTPDAGPADLAPADAPPLKDAPAPTDAAATADAGPDAPPLPRHDAMIADGLPPVVAGDFGFPPDPDQGCGCRTADEGSDRTPLALALALLAGAWRRARRRRR